MIATQMLIEEAEAFSGSDLDVRNVNKPQMKIRIQDPASVQRN